MSKLEMHSPPLERSVTAPNNPALAATKTQANSIAGNIPRHRSLSPNSQSRTHSNDSPRPSDLLYRKSASIGNPSSLSYLHSHPNPQLPALEIGSSGLHTNQVQALQPPMNDASEASSSSLGKVYISAEASLRSSKIQNTPQNEADYDYLRVLQKPNYHSNTSSQSCLSFYVPPTFDTERMHVDDEHSRTSGFTWTDSEKDEAQGKASSYATAGAQRSSGVFTEKDILDLQFPILMTPDLQSLVQESSILRIDPGYFERKLSIEDSNPSFHRSINSPVQGEPPDEALVEQVAPPGAHHSRSDTLGQLSRVTAIKELPPPPPSITLGSPGKITQLELAGMSKRPAIAPPIVPSEEITPSTVVLPGEYFRRRHSGSHILSHGHRDFGLNLQIIDHVPASPSPKIVVEPRVSSDRPPNTPESPFTMISREKTKLRGRRQNSPSSLITFLSVINPTETCGVPRSLRPKPFGKVNPSELLPVMVPATVAICLAPAYGETHIFLTGMDSSTHTPNAPPAFISRDIIERSPCMRSLRRVIEKDDLKILSRGN